MPYLHAGPPELEDDSEGRVVDELGPAVRGGAADARHEDEGEARQHADQTHQVPGLLLPVLPAHRQPRHTLRSIYADLTCRE